MSLVCRYCQYWCFVLEKSQIKIKKKKLEFIRNTDHVVIFKPLSYCFEETIGFDVKASFASRPVSRQQPRDITKEL